MSDTFYLGAYWGDRRCTAEECGQRAAQCLGRLAECDEAFVRWFPKGRSRKEASRFEVIPDSDQLTNLFLAGTNRRDIGKSIIQELGFRTSLWNGGRGGEAASIAFSCGCHAQNSKIVNSCVLNFPDEGAAAERVLRVGALEMVMEAVVSAWEPDWATVVSHQYRERVDTEGRRPIVGWLFYLSHQWGAPSALVPPSRLIRLGEHGNLVVVTGDRFSVDDTEHLRAIDSVSHAFSEALEN